MARAFSSLALAGMVTVMSLVPAAVAAVPAYGELELQCRSNFDGAYNLPDGAFFTSSTPDINNADQVTIKISVISGSDSQGIWLGGGGSGEIEFLSDVGAFFGDPSLNDLGRAVFQQYFATVNGIYYYDSVTDAGGFLTSQPLGASSWSSPQINDAGEVGYRVSFNGPYAWVSYDGSAVAVHVTDASADPGSPYSYLFTPAFNDARQIAGKVRLGAAGQIGNDRPDQIRIFESDGSSVLVAEDQDSNGASPFSGFDNSVALTDGGKVAFVASLVGGGRGVYLHDGSEIVEIATTSDADVSDIEFFHASANDDGLVVFRGLDGSGLQTIFVGDGNELGRVISEHDLVATDLGQGRIDQHDSSPVFGGSPVINAAGNVVFQAGLTPPGNNQIEWGSGLFVAYAEVALLGDMDCNEVVNFDDIDGFVLAVVGQAEYEAAYPDCRWLNADCNEDGLVTFDDISPFIDIVVGGGK